MPVRTPADRSPRADGESQQILSTLARVLSRRKAVLVLCMLGVLAPVLYYNQTAIPIYEASTRLAFEELVGPVQTDVYNTTREIQLFNRIEEMNSRAFADDIAKALPESLKTRLRVPQVMRGEFDTLQHIGEVIHKSITAYPLRNTNIVGVRVQMSDPYLCRAVANLSQSVLQERNYRIRQEGVTDLRRFIEDQLARFKIQLQESEDRLMRFKERNRITSLDDESKETLRKMTEAEVLYNKTRADRGAARQRLAAVEQTLASQRGALVPSVTSIASPSAQSLKDKLVALQTQYAELAAQNYPVGHPRLVQLRQVIDQTKKALVDEAMKLSKGSSVGDPIAQLDRFVQESVSLQIEVESLRARENALKRTLEEYRNALSTLPTQEVELARLVRERDVDQKIYTSLLENREEIRISEAKQIPNTRVIDQAQLPQEPILPRKKLNLAMGSVLGLILGFGVGLFLEGGKGSFRSMVEFEEETGWPVLALVPRTGSAFPKLGRLWRGWKRRGGWEGDRKRALVSHLGPSSAGGESYFILRTRLELLGLGTKYKSLLVTSSGPRDGKSSTLSNLAATFGAAGRAALIVDAELRRPVIHSIFGIHQEPGLSDLLLSRNGEGAQAAEGEAISAAPAKRKASYPSSGPMFQTTPVAGVTVLASGRRVRETQWEVARAEMGTLLTELKNGYDVVLVDSAPPILVHDTLALCSIVDAVVVIVDSQSYDSRRLMETKRLLERAGANIVGAVVNKVDTRGSYAHYYNHRYTRVTHEHRAG